MLVLALVIAGSYAVLVAAIGALASLMGVVVALKRVQTVHVLVNSANKELRQEVRTLMNALQKHGIATPVKDDKEE